MDGKIPEYREGKEYYIMDTPDEKWFRNKHIEMWQWIIDNITSSPRSDSLILLKKAWPGWTSDVMKKSPSSKEFLCFACGWGHVNSSTENNCEGCPIDWGVGLTNHEWDDDWEDNFTEPCLTRDAAYLHCLRAKYVTERIKYATQIRDSWRPIK